MRKSLENEAEEHQGSDIRFRSSSPGGSQPTAGNDGFDKEESDEETERRVASDSASDKEEEEGEEELETSRKKGKGKAKEQGKRVRL